MLYDFKPFWSSLIKGGEAYEFDSLQAGPYGRLLYVLPSVYNSRFDTFGSLSCNTRRWTSAAYLLFCDAMINSACATINSALRSFCKCPFFIMHVIIFTYFSCMINCHHKLKRISTSTTCHVHLHTKSKLLICTSSGGAFATYEDNNLSFTISHILFPVENFN